MDGTIKFYDRRRGYGFILPEEGGPDVFYHFSQVRDANQALEPGQSVTYELDEHGRRGPEAADIRVQGERLLPTLRPDSAEDVLDKLMLLLSCTREEIIPRVQQLIWEDPDGEEDRSVPGA